MKANKDWYVTKILSKSDDLSNHQLKEILFELLDHLDLNVIQFSQLDKPVFIEIEPKE